MERSRFLALIGAIIVLTAGCTIPGSPTPPPGPSQVWILEPEEGAVLPPSPVLVKFQGASFTGVQEFEVLIDGDILGTYPPLSSGSGGPDYGTMFYGEASWDPQSQGDYTIRVRARNASFQSSPYAEVHVTVQEHLVAVVTPGVLELVPTATSTLPPWHLAAVLDVNCRLGPGPEYAVTSFLRAGEAAEAAGRNPAGTWLQLVDPRGAGLCWASSTAFEPDFNVQDLPIRAAPPLPTATEEPGATGCLVTSVTGETRCVSPCPAGATGPACKP